MTAVVFNADDFGLTAGVTRGIVESFERGVVRSTTAMVCKGNLDALAASAPCMRGHIGLHLQVTDGTPALPGHPPFPRTRDGVVVEDPVALLAEFDAQLLRLRSLGVEPTHLDTHHHTHWLPSVLPVFVEFAKRTDLPARSGPPEVVAALRAAGVRTLATCETTWFRPAISAERLVRMIRKTASQFPGEPFEVMCHPGYADDELRAASTYAEEREQELAVLCSDELRQALNRAEITLLDGFQRTTDNGPPTTG